MAGYIGSKTVNLSTTGADIASESTEVQAICNAVHTQAVKDAYAAHLEAQETP